MALLIVLYQVAMKLRGMPIDRNAISALARWLWLFMILRLTPELLEAMTLSERAETLITILRMSVLESDQNMPRH